MFATLTEWFNRRRVLRDLRAQEPDGDGGVIGGFSRYFLEELDSAWKTYNVGNRELALRMWRKLNEGSPKQTVKSHGALKLLVELGQYDDAEAMLRKGRRRYPYLRAMYGAVSAYLARGRGDIEQAILRCATLRREHPDMAEGYVIASDCLARLGRYEEAETIAEQAAKKFPDRLDMVAAFARQAARRNDWAEALRRWEAVRDRFDSYHGPVGMAQCLRKMGRHDEARECAVLACERAPRQPWGYAELADNATASGDFAAASEHWKSARDQCPEFARGYISGAVTERRLGRQAEADAILGIGIARLRYDLDVHLAYARDADRRGDHAAAADRWALVRERFPGCEEARAHEVTAPGE